MRGADLINLALPEELLGEVLRRVGGAKRDLDACSLVCRRWRRLERATRRSAKLAASGDRADEVLRLVSERFPALVDVSVDERLTIGAAGVSSSAVRSRRPVYGISPFGSRRRMSRIPDSAMQMSPFTLDWPTSDDVTGRTCLTDVGLTNLARGCKGLEKLSLIWCSAISSTGLVRIADNCKNLNSLDLQACYIGDPGLIAIGEGCKLLSNLNLRCVEGATDEGLIGLIKTCGQSLVSLGVAACAWMTDASLHSVGSHCPNLEILSLESDHIKNEGLISIAKGCRLLKILKLQCIGAGDEALEAIGSFCSFLESLSLHFFASMAGGFCEELSLMLQELGFPHRPEYRCTFVPSVGYNTWKVRLLVYTRSQSLVEDRPFYFTSERLRIGAALQDAARQALIHLGSSYNDKLEDTPYRFFPCHEEGRCHNRFRSLDREANPTIVYMGSLIRAQDEAYVSATHELQDLYQRLAAAREKIRQLKETQQAATLPPLVPVQVAPLVAPPPPGSVPEDLPTRGLTPDAPPAKRHQSPKLRVTARKSVRRQPSLGISLNFLAAPGETGPSQVASPSCSRSEEQDLSRSWSEEDPSPRVFEESDAST